ASYGVMQTPALVIDGEVKIIGKVAKVDEIKALLTNRSKNSPTS
ncbi:MAG: thioredoxin family protein, partial [Anaerovorax sp.]